MLGAWLAAEGLLGIKNKWWMLGIALILAASATVIAIADNAVEDFRDTAKDAGAATAVVAGQRDILNQVERANNAEQEISRSGDAARFDRCLRIATPDTRANCERFRPVSD